MEAWQRNVWALALCVFIAFVGFQFFNPFLPLYVRELGVTDPAAVALWSGALAAVTPAVSGLLAPLFGRLADRFGRRRVLTLSFLLAPPGVALYLADGGVLGLAGIALAGAGIISTFGITIVLSQEYLPSRLSTAAGLSIGLSIGLGGVASFAIGTLADAVGIVDALWTIPAAALLGTVLCALLPPPDAPQTVA